MLLGDDTIFVYKLSVDDDICLLKSEPRFFTIELNLEDLGFFNMKTVTSLHDCNKLVPYCSLVLYTKYVSTDSQYFGKTSSAFSQKPFPNLFWHWHEKNAAFGCF